MSMNPDQVAEIVRRLRDRTSQSGFSWRESDAEPDEYVTSTSRFRFFIRSRDADGRAPYIFEIYAPSSKREGAEFVVDSGEADLRDDLLGLYRVARRSATGFGEDMAAEVLADIDEVIPF